MSYCPGCGTKIGQPGCHCPSQEGLVKVIAFRNAEGHVFPNIQEAKRHEVFRRVEKAMVETGRGLSQREENGINWVLGNLNRLAKLLRDYPIKESDR